MGDYVAFLEGGSCDRRAVAVRTSLQDAGWRPTAAGGIEIWTNGPYGPDVVDGAGGALVGEVFARGSPGLGGGAHDPITWARELSTTAWGGFVALRRRRAGAAAALYRDPSGTLDAHLLRSNGLAVAASSLAAPGVRALVPGPAIRRDAVARWLTDPCESTATSGLMGVETVAPGVVLVLEDGAVRPQSVWSPGDWAARAGEVRRNGSSRDETDGAEQLREAVLRTASAFETLARPLLFEVSGGLDSALSTSAFTEGGRLGAIHFHAADAPESDERRYARAVTERCGGELEEITLGDELDIEALPQFASAARPSFNAADAPYDSAAAGAIAARGAWGWVTGQGGDAVFLNLRSPWLACDAVARGGWRAVVDPDVRELARRLRTSVWRVTAAALRARSRPDPWPSWSPLDGATRELEDLRSGGSRHPWLQDLGAIEPAKRLQVVGLAFALLNTGDSRRSRAARLIHLPLQQPVLEAALPIPAARLAPAGRDRALARAAFAHRLPSAVLHRRSKGDLTAVYGRRLTRALPILTPWLLDGELRRLGLIDPATLESRLTAEGLFIGARAGDLLKLASIEGWLRAWR